VILKHGGDRVATVLFVVVAAGILGLEALISFHLVPTERHVVESYCVWLVLLGCAVASLTCQARDEPAPKFRRPRLLALAACVAGSFILYWPIRNVGFLSDDFVLAASVRAGDVIHTNPTFFRPFPLLIWWLLFKLGSGAVGLHLFNVAFHGLNAFLSGRLAERWVPARWPLIVSALFLVTPLAVEPVVWCSGVFDVTATTFCLSAVLWFRPGRHPRWRVIAFAASAVAAILSKETAVVLPGLLLIDAIARGAWSRRLLGQLVLVSVPLVLFAIWRVTAVADQPYGVPTKYAVQKALFSAFGSAFNPWHETSVLVYPILPVIGTAFGVLIFAVFVLFEHRSAAIRRLSAAAFWIVTPCVPVMFFLPVLPDLQSSRYLYLPTVGRALFVAVAGSGLQHSLRKGTWVVGPILLFAVLCACVLRWQLRPWLDAAEARTTILAAVATDERLQRCTRLSVSNLPEHTRGAYTFRNGFEIAVEMTLHRPVEMTDVPAACQFRWDPSVRALIQ
jgi:hypothetical protein